MKDILDFDTESVASTSAKIVDPVKKAWCQTQWSALSQQARALKMEEIYFDFETNLLDKQQNKQLWRLLVGHFQLVTLIVV